MRTDLFNEYPWSSYAAKIGRVGNAWLDFDPSFLSLAKALDEQRKSYANFVNAGIKPGEQSFIQQAVERNQLTGGRTFVDEIESRLGVRIETRGPGRPAK